MMILISAWVMIGSLFWAAQIIQNGSQLGLIGDLVIALPFCILFAPLHLLHKMLL